MSSPTLIVTHPGQAHRDEFLAISLLMGACTNEKFRIERRNPTEEELKTSSVWVIDVGRQYDQEMYNLDHHQDAQLPCSFFQVLDLYESREDFIKEFGWVTMVDMLDRKGPYQSAKELGISVDNFFNMISPIESHLLKKFSEMEVVEDWLIDLMRQIGNDLWHKVHDSTVRQKELQENAVQYGWDGIMVLCHWLKDNPTFGLQRFRDEHYPEAQVSICADDRGPGLTLYRFNDDPAINFSKIADDPRIEFAHANGFIAKTKSRELSMHDLMELVITSKV